MLKMAIIIESSVVPTTDMEPFVEAMQMQVSQDFFPAYNLDATLRLITDIRVLQPDEWLTIILDNSDQAGALGYHLVAPNGQPMAKVFAKSDQSYGLLWTVTASHEILETLADPYTNLMCVNPLARQPYLIAYEVADPVEADLSGYTVMVGGTHKVTLSNFVLPSWFEPQGVGPYDHQSQLTKPFSIAKGGYVSTMPLNPPYRWQQVFNEDFQDTRHQRIADSPRRLARWSKVPGNVDPADLYSGVTRGELHKGFSGQEQ